MKAKEKLINQLSDRLADLQVEAHYADVCVSSNLEHDYVAEMAHAEAHAVGVALYLNLKSVGREYEMEGWL